MELVQAIRDRRERSVQRALALLSAYEAADAATRTSLLQLSGIALRDERVATRWLEVLASENDPGFRAKIIEQLSTLDFRALPATAIAVARLVECLDQPDAREWALYCLHRLAPRDPSLIAPLIAAYRDQHHDDFARRILANLLTIAQPTPELLAFFQTLLDETNRDTKTVIVRRLLEQNALCEQDLKRLLTPGEPELIKVMVLDHLVDRSIRADDLAAVLLSADPDPSVRYAAAWLLTETGAPAPNVLSALLKCAQSDPDDRVREFTLATFSHTLVKAPETLAALVAALPSETSTERAAFILQLLTPYLRENSTLVSALQKQVEQNLSAELAVEIYTALGALAPWLLELKDWLVASFTREKHDRIKAAILRPLASLDETGPQALQLCRNALTLSDPELQQWGARGILLLPLTPEFIPAILESASVLLIKDLPLDLRLNLARKLALVPQKPPELIARFKEVSAQAREAQLQRVCENVLNAAVNNALTPDPDGPDWDGWIQRAEVEHRGNGIFPAIYEQFDRNPDAARRVLKALLNPACTDSLYSCYGYSVTASSILDLLDRKNALDDDASAYIVGKVLTQDSGSADGFLQFLPSNPKWPKLKAGILTIIERRPDANVALLREILVAAFGDDDATAAALAEKFKTLRGNSFAPFVRLLTENLAWPPARELLVGLSASTDLSGALINDIHAALKKLGLAPAASATETESAPPPKAEPGFADD